MEVFNKESEHTDLVLGTFLSFVKFSLEPQQHMVVLDLGNSPCVSFGLVSFRSQSQWGVSKGIWDCSKEVQMADTSAEYIFTSSHCSWSRNIVHICSG